MTKVTQPIAVFDSGLGGISVLKNLIQLMPNENYIYFGDSLNAPYGIKSSEDVLALTVQNIEMLLKKGAKAIVLACNTATSAAARDLREKYPDIPIIGMEPALKPATTSSLNGQVLVMATEMTLKEKKFATLLEQYKNQSEITLLPAPGLVSYVENGVFEGPEIDFYLWRLLAPYQKIRFDAVVLGCTHFPFVKESILQALGYSVEIFDGLLGTAKETERQLNEKNLRSEETGKGSIQFLNSRSEEMPNIINLCYNLLEA